MSETAKGSDGPAGSGSGGRLGSLSKGAKWLGGIIVVALVGALVPLLVDSFKKAEKLDAALENVSIRKPVSLDEYKLRQENEFAMFEGGATHLRLVAAYEAVPAAAAEDPGEEVPESRGTEDQPADDEPTTPDDQTTTPDDQTTTPDDQTTTPDDQTTTPDDQTTTPDEDGTTRSQGIDDIAVDPRLGRADRAAMSAGVQEAIRASQQNLIVPLACVQDATADSCGLRSLQLQLGVSGEAGAEEDISTEEVARRLVQVFKGTRTQPAPDDPGKRELVGVSVQFDVSMTGFSGRTVDVRWTLFGAGGTRVPRPWLRNQLALQLKGEANEDSGSGEFWVPIPQARGPFYIQIRVYDDKGSQLARADTRRFR